MLLKRIASRRRRLLLFILSTAYFYETHFMQSKLDPKDKPKNTF